MGMVHLLFALQHVQINSQSLVIGRQLHTGVLAQYVLDDAHESLVRSLDHNNKSVDEPVLVWVDRRGCHQTRSAIRQLRLQCRVELGEIIAASRFGRYECQTLGSGHEHSIVFRQVPVVKEDKERAEDVDDFSFALLIISESSAATVALTSPSTSFI